MMRLRKVFSGKKAVILLLGLALIFFASLLLGAPDSQNSSSGNMQAEKKISGEQTTDINGSTAELVSPKIQEPDDKAEPPAEEKQKTQKPSTKLYKVTRAVDGDTVELETGERLRYIGVDTPEISGQAECYGREAYEKNKSLVEGKLVRLEKDVSETDKYGRLLRYVYLNDTMVNDYLVKEGFARASSYPPDVKYQELFRQSETQAREEGKGLWKGCAAKSQSTQSKSQFLPSNANMAGATAGFSCDCSKSCSEILSCEEAQFQLKNCGCSARDADADGIACDGAPLSCQN